MSVWGGGVCAFSVTTVVVTLLLARGALLYRSVVTNQDPRKSIFRLNSNTKSTPTSTNDRYPETITLASAPAPKIRFFRAFSLEFTCAENSASVNSSFTPATGHTGGGNCSRVCGYVFSKCWCRLVVIPAGEEEEEEEEDNIGSAKSVEDCVRLICTLPLNVPTLAAVM